MSGRKRAHDKVQNEDENHEGRRSSPRNSKRSKSVVAERNKPSRPARDTESEPFDAVKSILELRRRVAASQTKNTSLKTAEFGEVGFTYTKFFSGHGLFTGMVAQIRPGAAKDKDRRCIYTDGDMEDLSLKDLTEIVRLQKRRDIDKGRKDIGSKESSSSRRANRAKTRPSSRTSNRRHSAPEISTKASHEQDEHHSSSQSPTTRLNNKKSPQRNRDEAGRFLVKARSPKQKSRANQDSKKRPLFDTSKSQQDEKKVVFAVESGRSKSSKEVDSVVPLQPSRPSTDLQYLHRNDKRGKYDGTDNFRSEDDTITRDKTGHISIDLQQNPPISTVNDNVKQILPRESTMLPKKTTDKNSDQITRKRQATVKDNALNEIDAKQASSDLDEKGVVKSLTYEQIPTPANSSVKLIEIEQHEHQPRINSLLSVFDSAQKARNMKSLRKMKLAHQRSQHKMPAQDDTQIEAATSKSKEFRRQDEMVTLKSNQEKKAVEEVRLMAECGKKIFEKTALGTLEAEDAIFDIEPEMKFDYAGSQAEQKNKSEEVTLMIEMERRKAGHKKKNYAESRLKSELEALKAKQKIIVEEARSKDEQEKITEEARLTAGYARLNAGEERKVEQARLNDEQKYKVEVARLRVDLKHLNVLKGKKAKEVRLKAEQEKIAEEARLAARHARLNAGKEKKTVELRMKLIKAEHDKKVEMNRLKDELERLKAEKHKIADKARLKFEEEKLVEDVRLTSGHAKLEAGKEKKIEEAKLIFEQKMKAEEARLRAEQGRRIAEQKRKVEMGKSKAELERLKLEQKMKEEEARLKREQEIIVEEARLTAGYARLEVGREKKAEVARIKFAQDRLKAEQEKEAEKARLKVVQVMIAKEVQLKSEQARLKAEQHKKVEDARLKFEHARLTAEKKKKAKEVKLKNEVKRLEAERYNKIKESRLQADLEKFQVEQKMKAEEDRSKNEQEKKIEEVRLKSEHSRLKSEKEMMRKAGQRRRIAEQKRKVEMGKSKAELERLKLEQKMKEEEARLKREQEIIVEEARLTAGYARLEVGREKKAEVARIKFAQDRLKAEQEKEAEEVRLRTKQQKNVEEARLKADQHKDLEEVGLKNIQKKKQIAIEQKEARVQVKKNENQACSKTDIAEVVDVIVQTRSRVRVEEQNNVENFSEQLRTALLEKRKSSLTVARKVKAAKARTTRTTCKSTLKQKINSVEKRRNSTDKAREARAGKRRKEEKRLAVEAEASHEAKLAVDTLLRAAKSQRAEEYDDLCLSENDERIVSGNSDMSHQNDMNPPLQRKNDEDVISILLRMSKFCGKESNADEIKDNEAISTLLNLDASRKRRKSSDALHKNSTSSSAKDEAISTLLDLSKQQLQLQKEQKQQNIPLEEECKYSDLFSDSSSSKSSEVKDVAQKEEGRTEDNSDDSDLFSVSSTSAKTEAADISTPHNSSTLGKKKTCSTDSLFSDSSASSTAIRISANNCNPDHMSSPASLRDKNIDISDSDLFSCSSTSSTQRAKSPVPKKPKDIIVPDESTSIDNSPNRQGIQIDKEDMFASVSTLLPQDSAAEATLKNDPKKIRKETQDEFWLHKVASLLGATNTSNANPYTRMGTLDAANIRPDACMSSVSVDNPVSDSCSSLTLPDEKENPIDFRPSKSYSQEQIAFLKSLSSFKKGDRHGLKVFHKEDKGRVVGEIIMEHDYGWVEAIIGGVLQKARHRNFVVVPSDYRIGQRIDADIPLPGDTGIIQKLPNRINRLQRSNGIINPGTRPDVGMITTNGVRCKIATTPPMALDSFFYWGCSSCDNMNEFTIEQCHVCRERRNPQCQSSALLEIAEKAVEFSSSIQDAIDSVPTVHRKSIPSSILSYLLTRKGISVDESQSSDKRSHSVLESYFYWDCNVCTMTNSYKRLSACQACGQKRNSKNDFSALLQIAYEATRDAMSVKDAISNLPHVHKQAVPEMVLNHLVTCTAIVNKDQRRCLRQRLPGSDYCSVHNIDTPLSLTATPNQMEASTGMVSESSKQNGRKRRYSGVNVLKNDVSNFLSTKIQSNKQNAKNWTIHCVEDAILCEYQTPFPLGLLVRKYFVGYGFHDGYIKNIIRQTVQEPSGSSSISRPVLTYRVQYNDGDEEDLMHHEINSLRQLYNLYRVKSTEALNRQFVPGTVYETYLGIIEMIETDVKQDGSIAVKFFKVGKGWSTITVDVRKLQLSVVRKCKDSPTFTTSSLKNNGDNMNDTPYLSKKNLCLDPPFLEWPFGLKIQSHQEEIAGENNDKGKETKLFPSYGLALKTESDGFSDFDDHSGVLVRQQNSDKKSCSDDCILCDEQHVRSGVEYLSWDPAGAKKYVVWDPYQSVSCEICKRDNNDHQMLICDQCENGYHMYCLRPMIVNVPANEWLCPDCSGGGCIITNFEDTITKYSLNQDKVTSFLTLPFNSPSEFHDTHRGALQVFANKFAGMLTTKTKPTTQVDALYFSRHSDHNIWRLPIPLTDPKVYSHSLTTMVAAMDYCGMTNYTENLVYSVENDVNESMNDANLDNVEPLSRRNLEVFQRYKENLKNGIFAPVEIVYDEKIGFKVKALAAIPRHTIITEYIGDVITVKRSEERSSDSLMMLLDTGDPKTSLIIDPTKNGNIARFFSGINNISFVARRKANVRTRRFVYEGKCRVLLFTSKRVEPGDELHYDYNAGNEGKSVAEWAKTGFYDTSNFF